jgi:hypothetical protein
MKKILAVLAAVLLVGFGCAKSSAPSVNTNESVNDAVSAEKKMLTIEVKTRHENDVPIGFDVVLSGAVEEKMSFAVDGKGRRTETPMAGTEVGRSGFYWAGARYDLVFVRKDDALQIQQMEGDEMGSTTWSVLRTLFVPRDVQISVK